jgi:hypothetical protein
MTFLLNDDRPTVQVSGRLVTDDYHPAVELDPPEFVLHPQ